MSLSKQTRIRLPRIKKGLIDGLTLGQIADICKVTEKTIDRDKQQWIRSGDFENWLREEWVRYHIMIGKKDPVEVYRQLSKLVGRQIAQRISAEVKQDVKFEITWKEKDDSS